MDLLVPVVTLLDGDRVDEAAAYRYAAAFRRWAVDATALVCGTTGLGDTLPAATRASLFAIWGEHLPADRLVCCAWQMDEARRLAGRGVRVLLAGTAVGAPARLAEAVRDLHGDVFVYSHPRFGWVVTPRLVAELRERGAQPRGFKLSKAAPATIAESRAAGGEGLVLWDGTARHVRESVAAGADGVVAACLAALPPARRPTGPAGLQRLVDTWLARLDAVPERRARIGWLTGQVRGRLGGGT